MRSRFLTVITPLVVIFVWSAGIANAQGAPGNGKFKPIYEKSKTDQQFDPHDFTGIWEMTVRDHTLGTKPPPLTPAGVAAMAGRVPDKSPVIGNAPWCTCNPMGSAKLPNDDEPIAWI